MCVVQEIPGIFAIAAQTDLRWDSRDLQSVFLECKAECWSVHVCDERKKDWKKTHKQPTIQKNRGNSAQYLSKANNSAFHKQPDWKTTSHDSWNTG